MEELEEHLKKVSGFFKRMNSKVKLITLLNAAKSEYENHNLENGYEALKQAYDLDNTNPVTLRGLGCFKQAEGDFEGAIEFYQKALEFSQAKEVEYTLIGAAYYVQNNLEEALTYFNHAIDENDNYDSAYEGRNQVMLERHLKLVDLQEALKKYF